MGIKVDVVRGEWGTRRGSEIDEKISGKPVCHQSYCEWLYGFPWVWKNKLQWEVSLPIMATEANKNNLPDLGHFILPNLVLTYDDTKKESVIFRGKNICYEKYLGGMLGVNT